MMMHIAKLSGISSIQGQSSNPLISERAPMARENTMKSQDW